GERGGGDRENSSAYPQNLKFTTNQGQNTLLNQFKNALSDNNTQNLSFLIGFFRISGFIHLHKLLQERGGYERFQSIRILVGLNVDSLIYELSQKGLDYTFQKDRFRTLWSQNQKEALEKEDYDKNVDDSILSLKVALESKQIQMRIVRDKNCHAKFYLFTQEPRQSHTGNINLYNGYLIVGSSNLTHNGLEKNYEVNLLSKDEADVSFALNEFERLWKDSIEISIEDINRCVKQSYLEILSPKDIYYKLLLTHFGKDFLVKDNEIPALFKDYIAYDYQIHAVQEGLQKLKKYNGFFLADVVGLGKTLIASVIAKKCRIDNLKGKILIVAPPSVKKSWKKHFDDINIANYEIYTHDSLHKIPKETREDIELIIIDESHNFRSSTSNRYKELENICKIPFNGAHKKIILLSATPQNNSPKDLANQVYLFCNRRNSLIEGLNNLEKFFSDLQTKFENSMKELKIINQNTNLSIQEKESAQNKEKKKLENIANTLRDKLLSHIMIRRTRGDIELLYKDDMKKQNLTFPKIEPPKDLLYDLDSNSHNLAKETIAFLSKKHNNIGTFSYVRYLIFPNLTQDGQEEFLSQYGEDEKSKGFYNDTAERLSVLIQKILFKRFDSSIDAFKATLENQITSHNALIAMFSEGTIALPKGYNSREKLYEAVLSDNDKDLQNLLEKKEDKFIHLQSHHFKNDFYQKLQNDRDALEKLLNAWENIQGDSKLDKLKDSLDKYLPQSQKIVIFTEAATTAKYLAKELIAYTILQIDASNREENEQKIKENFDANYPQEKQKDEFNIIITTDTLAEGINLHRANIIINYDTPYNSTRLMQRIGRINRIGTSFEKIHIYNFKPTHLADEIININSIASGKLQSFHYTLGEDSAIYDDEEIVGSKNLYSQIDKNNQETSKDSQYKKALQDFYKNHKDEFDRIEHLPLKSRTIIQSHQTQSFAYIRHISSHNHAHFYPYHIVPSQNLLQEPQTQECDFYEMADFLKAHLESCPLKNADMSVHYTHIQSAMQSYKQSLKSRNTPNPTKKELKPQEITAISKINSCQELDSQVKENLIDLIKNGHPQLTKETINIKAKNSADFAREVLVIKEKFAPNADLQTSKEQDYNTIDSATHTEPQIQISITTIHLTKGIK
ncbi:helicase-related protein, partial [Helicobacter typhlonius]|uniref:helicase-related protein n=1 Tax=Helicobacter typhlonius TaxID=76936 RepID=UPI002FE07FFA